MTRTDLRTEIARLQDQLIDWEITISDHRTELTRTIDRVCAAVRERDRVADRLVQLILEFYDDTDSSRE